MEMYSGEVGDALSLVVFIHSFLLGLRWMIDYLVVFSLNRICKMGSFDNSRTKKHGEIISCCNLQMAINLCPSFRQTYIFMLLVVYSNTFKIISLYPIHVLCYNIQVFMFGSDPKPKPWSLYPIKCSLNYQYCISHVRPMSYNNQKSVGKLSNGFPNRCVTHSQMKNILDLLH